MYPIKSPKSVFTIWHSSNRFHCDWIAQCTMHIAKMHCLHKQIAHHCKRQIDNLLGFSSVSPTFIIIVDRTREDTRINKTSKHNKIEFREQFFLGSTDTHTYSHNRQ